MKLYYPVWWFVFWSIICILIGVVLGIIIDGREKPIEVHGKVILVELRAVRASIDAATASIIELRREYRVSPLEWPGIEWHKMEACSDEQVQYFFNDRKP